MPILLYGLTLPGDPRPDGAAGVGGVACRVLACGEADAIVATLDAKPAPDLAAIRAHDGALRAFVAAGASVAAVRFGQWFDDEAGCIAELRSRAPRIAALLREHRGCVEMRVLLPVEAPRDAPAPDATAGPGRAYLEALRAQGGVAPALALRPMLGPMVRGERVEGFAAPEGARGVAFAHLVHRDDLAAYRQSLRESPALAGARVVGPLPLYSFAEPA